MNVCRFCGRTSTVVGECAGCGARSWEPIEPEPIEPEPLEPVAQREPDRSGLVLAVVFVVLFVTVQIAILTVQYVLIVPSVILIWLTFKFCAGFFSSNSTRSNHGWIVPLLTPWIVFGRSDSRHRRLNS